MVALALSADARADLLVNTAPIIPKNTRRTTITSFPSNRGAFRSLDQLAIGRNGKPFLIRRLPITQTLFTMTFGEIMRGIVILELPFTAEVCRDALSPEGNGLAVCGGSSDYP